VLAGCGSGGTGTDAARVADAPPVHTVAVTYAPPRDADAKLARELLRAGGTTDIATGLVHDFRLPWDVKVVVRNTSDSGPAYDPSS